MVYQLEALGGLRLVAADGRVIHTQRRRLALLALLAAAGERGLTRDQLMGCLWPENPEDNARHALNQLLYGIRRSLGERSVEGADSLRLDPAVVDSDVRRFEKSVADGEYAAAVAHYRGSLLEGFYLADAPEFERWVDRERARLAGSHARALEGLAAEAESRGDVSEAVTWRRALVDRDPLDARRAASLMRALAAAGDSAGAIAHGRTYETLVRQELDAPADAAVLALTSEIRASAARHADRPAIPAASPAFPPDDDAPPGERHPDGGQARGDMASDALAQPARPSRRRRLAIYGVAALALATASFAVGGLSNGRPGDGAAMATPARSIAVLPLRNLSVDPNDAALADGMTEELIAVLSRMGGLRVIASTSVYALEARRMDVRQIAESLRVTHVLEGGLQKAGHRVRLQLRLIDARDGATRWSAVYDREIGDVFAAQDDIARAVTRELGVRLSRGGIARPASRRHTPRIEAYEAYLRGTDPTLTRTTAGTEQARRHLESAIAADSIFAAAYAELAHVYIVEAGDVAGTRRDAYVRAEQVALRAVALDDSLPAAHVALGRARLVRRNWSGAESAFDRAVALDQNASEAFQGLALLYLWTGRPAAQLAAARAGTEIDPVSMPAISRMAFALAMNRRCDEAIERLRPLKSLRPPEGVAGVISGQCYAAEGRWPEAIAEFRWAIETTDARTALSFLAYALARAGRREEATIILSDLLAGRKHSHGAFGIATVYAGLGDYDRAFAWLERSAQENSVRPYLMGPMFEDLREDPRFEHVRRGLGL